MEVIYRGMYIVICPTALANVLVSDVAKRRHDPRLPAITLVYVWVVYVSICICMQGCFIGSISLSQQKGSAQSGPI